MKVYVIYKIFETNSEPTLWIYKTEDREKAYLHLNELNENGIEYDIIIEYIMD